jgi:hypothetical protein
MSLDKELTAAFSREAETREVPPPDVDRLIRAGQARRRRRNARRIGAAMAAVVIVGGGAYGVAQVDPGDPAPVAVPPTTSQPEPATVPSRFPDSRNMASISPGTYRVFVGSDTASETIEADLTMTNPTSNWSWSGQPVVHEPTVDAWAGVGVYQPLALADVAPCSGDWQSRRASGTPQSLARQLVRLPWSTIVEPPTPTEAFGHDAIHLRLHINDRCPWDEYYQIAKAEAQPAESLAGSRGISYGTTSEEVVIDFWVVDLGGTAVVVDKWHQVDSSVELVDRATEVLDSIQFVMSE